MMFSKFQRREFTVHLKRGVYNSSYVQSNFFNEFRPLAYANSLTCVMTALYLDLVGDELTKYTYYADVAGLSSYFEVRN
jgi:secreted Zn-dependent insulinase-like peptidase